ncbi:MAG: hypothetical protein A2168_00075 [Planctomycetes bacterium RBG_13_50_24]|nr:MAG: hypothetical protein A2168_00075 [Planctomycetes bacterium RBG_13_50_24]
MFAPRITFGLSGHQKQSGIFAIRLLILLVICFFGLPANAITNIYVFVPGQSTVVQTGGFAGVYETYGIEGKFRLTVDFDAGIASFDKVDANLTEPTGFLYSQSLGEIFNMTALAGTIINDTTIDFEGKTADGTGSDVRLKLSFSNDSAHLTGKTTPPPNSADMFLYELDAVAIKKYAGGTGEPNNPYQIATAAHLTSIGSDPDLLDKHFALIDDIDLDPNLPNGQVFTQAVIAPDIDTDKFSHGSPAFIGVFDGQGHFLSNLVIEDPNGEHLGLFGYVGKEGSVLNLHVENATIKGSLRVGAIVGMNEGLIENCHVTGVLKGSNITGGICGENTGTIRYSHADVEVNGYFRAGGLLGKNDGRIVQCYTTGQVTGDDDVGGLLGSNHGSVISCYSWAAVSGSDFVGGLIGYDYGTITTSYAAVKVTASLSRFSRSGGLTGLTQTTAFSSYWDWETSGKGSSASGQPKTTQEMMEPETFRGWGHDGAWILNAGKDYPHLAWEGTAGAPIVDETNRYGGGTGEPDDPYEIWIAGQFSNIAWYLNDFDKHFALMSDIDMNDVDLNLVKPIGTQGNPFVGLFDGNHHIIRNFVYGIIPDTEEQNSEDINEPLGRYPHPPPTPKPVVPELTLEVHVGVFGVIGELYSVYDYPDRYNELQGTVKNLRIVDANIAGSCYVGGLAGVNRGVVSACSTSGNISGLECIGGLIGGNGYNGKGLARACFSVVDVVGQYRIGGLVGSNGEWYGIGVVESCYAAGHVEATIIAGGLAGLNEGTVITSYYTGEVTGDDRIGGLIGVNMGSCFLSYWDANSSGITTSTAGQAKTTMQMQDVSTFRGWGSQEHWTIDDGNDYPRLAWENREGDAIVDSQYAYGSGAGKPDNPYRIYTAEQFVEIAYRSADFDKHFILMQDIDLSVVDPNLILPIANDAFPFCGVFDGNNHTIYNFRYIFDTQSYVGVFGCMGSNVTEANKPNGRVANLNIVNATVSGCQFVGILAGNNQGTIASCSVQGVCSGASHVGGLAGGNQGTIEGTYFTGVVDGSWAVGGLVGRNFAEVVSCSFDGEVTGGDSVGGLVGRQNHLGILRASRAEGGISGTDRVGGLVGDNYGSIESSYSTCVIAGISDYIGGLAGASFGVQVAYCYSVGPVVGPNHVGGLIGGSSDRAYNCYWDVEASGIPSSSTGMGRPTSEMMRAKTFRGWGYPGVWTIEDGQDYPRLIWEQTPGRPIIDPEPRYSSGTGDPNTPYEIRTAQDFANLAYFQQDFDKHYVLTNDIDLSSVNLNLLMPIGTRPIPFTGVFNGNGHTISHFSYHAREEYSVGIFGAVEQSNAGYGLLMNLGIVNATISGQNICGALVGRNKGAIISCYSADSSIESPFNAGGLVGINNGPIITSWSSNTVNGRSNVGGLVGYNQHIITSCYSKSNVSGEEHVGGLAGASSGTITGSYSAGTVSGEIETGGILGANVGYAHDSWGEIFISFWDTQSSGFLDGVGNLEPDPISALGKITTEMQTAITFLDAGWDFVGETANGTEDIWWILEGQGYPRLWWELTGHESVELAENLPAVQ